MARSSRARIVRAALTLVVAGAFFFAMTAGEVWHHHDSAASRAACPICHLTHQGFAPAVADQAVALPRAIEWNTPAVEPFFLSGPLLSFTATRAPPAVLPA
jgi:hypothetical protein